MRFLIVLLLTVACAAQTQGNRPNVPDSFQSDTLGSTAGHVIYPEAIVSGDELVVCIDMDSTQPVPTVSDSLGNTWTMTTGTTTPAPQATKTIYMAYTNSSFSGSDTISYLVGAGGVVQTMSLARIKNLSGAIDGSVQSATYTGNGAGGPGSFNTSITTTTNGSVLFTCAGNSGFGTSFISASSNTEYLSNNQEQPGAITFLGMTYTTSAGAYTPTLNTYNDFAFGSHATFAAQTIAFKPSPTIFLADTALPDAATSVAYSAQLHCYGGTAGQTYSVFSGTLPTGLSLNTSTGVISGTPTGTTQTVGFRCTDGTVTSATDTLTLTVGAGFGTPSVRQSKACGIGSCTFTGTVDCGDLVVAYVHGFDTHGTSGWIQPSSGVNNNIFDTLGTSFKLIGPYAGGLGAPLVLYAGVATASGNDTLNFNQNTSASQLSWIVMDIANAQGVIDVGTLASGGSQAASPYSYSSTYQTVVPNEILATMIASIGGATFSLSPLSVQNSIITGFDSSALGFVSLSSPTSYTATTTVTSSAPRQDFASNLMHAFRPALPVAACGIFTGNFERIKRTIY